MSPPINPDPSSVTDQTRWFTDEIHRHDSSLRAYLHGRFPAVRDVDDVVQESYLRIWKKQPARSIDCARAFLFRVARNVALTVVKRDRVSPVDRTQAVTEFSAIDESAGVEATVCAREEYRLLAEAIDALPARCREIVILHRVHHLTQQQIAQRLGIAEETVGVQVARGVKKCNDYLRQRGVVFNRRSAP